MLGEEHPAVGVGDVSAEVQTRACGGDVCAGAAQ